jgi:hypothetical protein
MSFSSTDVPPKQCFSLIQSRKFFAGSPKVQQGDVVDGTGGANKAAADTDNNKAKTPLKFYLAELCPSMDLVLLDQGGILSIYRTLSWQKVAAILPATPRETTNKNGTTDKISGHSSSSSSSTSSSLCFCWSPNGHWVAVANSTPQECQISLYGVENLANPVAGVGGSAAPPSDGPASSGMGGAGPTDAQHSWSIVNKIQHPNHQTATVQSMHWIHVGRSHPTSCAVSAEEEEREMSWR